MKKILLVIIISVGSFVLWTYIKHSSIAKVIPPPVEDVASSPTIVSQKNSQEYLFVPYWSFTKNIVTDSNFSLIYFGVGVNNNGIDVNDVGYTKLGQFVDQTPNAREKILGIRMVDKNINAAVIKNLSTQEKIASRAVSLAKQHNFNGVLLDYETSAFAFESTTKNITSFYTLFAREAKKANLLFYVTLYGDTYHQARPFDVKEIGKLSDKVLIMAYDFSKSRGNPGPNFPLAGKDTYGYDFSTMVADFQKDISNDKLVVVLGYFGYDWRVDGQGASLGSGVPLSLNEIKKEFIDNCEFNACNLERVPNTSEPSIKYTDESGEKHIVWFEDEESVQKKKAFLRQKGILETSAWAYSYY